jgi:hypothetical protein
MLKSVVIAALAVGLMAAPLRSANAQYMQSATPAEPAKPAAKKPLTAGQKAAQERQKKCAAEWKDAKAAGKIEKGTTWPKYWSACNKRLKSAT